MPRVNLVNFAGGMKTSNRASNAEQFNAGCSVSSHFDVNKDYRRLKPVPSLEEVTETVSRGFKMVGLGSDTSSQFLYGVGEKAADWFSSDWDYRVLVTPTSNTTYFPTTSVPIFHINLSVLPVAFWTNVLSNGADIRVTDINNNPLPFWVETIRVNPGSRFGSLWVKGNIQQVYIYYGNSQAQQLSNLAQYGKVDTFSNFHRWYGWTGQTITDSSGLVSTRTNFSNEAYALDDGDIGSFSNSVGGPLPTGTMLNGSSNSDNMRDEPSDNPWSGIGGAITYFFVIRPTTTPTTYNIIDSAGTVADVTVTSARNVNFTVSGNPSDITITGNVPLTSNVFNTVFCTFQNGIGSRTIINGNLANTTASTSNLDNAGGGQAMRIGLPASSGLLGFVAIYGSPVSNDTAKSVHNSLVETSNVWTAGPQVAFTSITATYNGGVQLYKFDLSTQTWSEVMAFGMPVGAFTQSEIGNNVPIYPLRSSFVYDAEGFPAVWTTNDSQKRYGTTTLVMGPRLETIVTGGVNSYPFTRYDPVLNDSVSTGSDSTRFPMTLTEAVDKKSFFTLGRQEVSAISMNDIEENVFTAYGSVTASVNYGQYMAIGSQYRNQSAIQLWDLDSTTADEFIDLGKGQVRAVGVVDQYLFGVIDVFTFSEILSAGRQSMEVRVYSGNSQSQQVYRYDVPVTMEGQFTHVFDNSINVFGAKLSDGDLWYAKLPLDPARSEYLNGLWALGNNELSPGPNVSIYCDTSGIADLIQVQAIGNQTFLLDKDYKIWRINDSGNFTQVSKYETLVFDDSTPEDDKILTSIEVYSDELPVGQIVSVYYRKDTELDNVNGWVKICDHVSGMQKEAFIIESTEANLPAFKEIQFKIESIGGNADVKGFAFTYERTLKKE